MCVIRIVVFKNAFLNCMILLCLIIICLLLIIFPLRQLFILIRLVRMIVCLLPFVLSLFAIS